MELGVREWMLLAGGLLFVIVVADGIRRVLADRREEVRLSRNAKKGFPSLDGDDVEPRNSELLGEARVLSRDKRVDTSEQDVPVLLDTVEDEDIEEVLEAPTIEPAPVLESAHQESLALEPESIESQIVEAPQETDATAEPMPEVEEVVVLNVHAQPGSAFNGQQMLEVLLNHNVRFGNMDIFHRREDLKDSKRVQFSIANSVEPGHFSLDNFESFSTPGVTFFLQLPGPVKAMAAFKEMLTVANALAEAMDGAILDQQRNPVSQQTLEHMKQLVEDFERRSLVKKTT